MSEATMNANVVKAIKALPGFYALKLGASRYLRKGTPDVLAVGPSRCNSCGAAVHGHASLIEGKSAGEDPTDIQRAEMLRWKTAGATVEVYRSVDEALAIVRGEL